MIKHFRLEIDQEDAFDQRKRDVHAAITPAKLHEVLQTEDGALFSISCFGDRRVKVVIKRIDEALSSSDAGGVESLPKPEERR